MGPWIKVDVFGQIVIKGLNGFERYSRWVPLFVGSLLCTERFSPGTPVSPLLKNQHLT